MRIDSSVGQQLFARCASITSDKMTAQPPGTYADDPEFERFTTELSDKLFSLTSNISNLSNQIAKLGTKRETERVRERVQDLLEETSNGFKEVGEGLKKVQAWQDLGVGVDGTVKAGRS